MDKSTYTSKVLIGSIAEFQELLEPLTNQLHSIIENLSLDRKNSAAVFTDSEAAKFLKMSKKKLQNLRNSRKIGFVREDEGRKISYHYDHLMDYLKRNEIKPKK
jgi:hypothetical protein